MPLPLDMPNVDECQWYKDSWLRGEHRRIL